MDRNVIGSCRDCPIMRDALGLSLRKGGIRWLWEWIGQRENFRSFTPCRIFRPPQGQQKQEEGGDTSVLSFADPSLCEIQRLYDKSQDKYLDVGHLEVLVLGPGLLEGRRWESFLEFMKSDPLVGEDMYVFEGENVDNLMNLNQSLGTSLGQYLTGIYENRLEGRERKGVTLKEVYYFWYEENRLPELPTLTEENGQIQVNFV